MPQQPKIFVIDDDASVRKALERLLRASGLSCQTFASGGDFLQHVESTASGCVIMDLSMPEMDGHELQVKMDEKGFRLPVITLSAMDNLQIRDRARRLGAVGFFRKPVDDQALLDAIQWAIE